MAELQQVDLDIAGLEKELAGVHSRLSGFDDQLSAMTAQVEQSCKTLDDLKKLYRNDESEIRGFEDTIAKTQAKLNSVKTNKEYQAMLKAIDDLKLKSSNLEDTMLAALEQIEIAEAQKVSLHADLDDLGSDIEEQKAQITKKAEEQKGKIRRQQQEREMIWSQLPPKWQTLYQRAVQQGKGIGAAAVIEAVCQVCRVNLPPQLFIDLMRMNSIILCPNCQRIMYPNTVWDNEKKNKSAVGVGQAAADAAFAGLEESPNTVGQGAP